MTATWPVCSRCWSAGCDSPRRGSHQPWKQLCGRLCAHRLKCSGCCRPPPPSEITLHGAKQSLAPATDAGPNGGSPIQWSRRTFTGRSPRASDRFTPTQTRSPETRMDGRARHAILISTANLVGHNRIRADGASLGAAPTRSRRPDGPYVVGAGAAVETTAPASATPGVVA